MALSRRAASACVLLSTLADAVKVNQSPRLWDRNDGGFSRDPYGRLEAATNGSELADPAIMYAAREGGLSPEDTLRLLKEISKAAGDEGSFIVTVTDGGMLGMAKNMIYSLQTAPCKTPVLIIGLGMNLCPTFNDFPNTYCVEVFQSEGGSDENGVAWGTHDYWAVVFRKHVVLTLVGMAHNTRNIVYTDPDIVYLNDPMPYLIKTAEEGGYHITFSPNNMLAPNADSVDDIHETYETRGMEQIRIGPHKRRADINTGLFHMSSSKEVADLMLKTMRIFRDQEFVHGHYQQYSLVKALDESPDIHIGLAASDMLVNGNVFWGHRELLKNGTNGVISIHANWMPCTQKIPCMREAGLWMDPSNMHRLSFDVPPAKGMVARLDERMATVEECGAAAALGPRPNKAAPSNPKDLEPPRPNQPGCFLWLPKGCPEHNFHAQDNWRKTEGSNTRKQCLVDAKEMYKKWCGTDKAEMAYNPPTGIGPEEPQAPGCYVWIASGCEKHNFACSAAWRQISATEFKTKEQCVDRAPEKYNRWCEVQDAYTLWVPSSPELPQEPGCYAWFPTGCKEHPLSKKDSWIRDIWGEKSFNARNDKMACMGQRKTQIDAWCGISNVQMAFVPRPTTSW